MKVLVTGAHGFVSRNLIVRLQETKKYEILEYTRASSDEQLRTMVGQADFIFHLAGVNRPKEESEFVTGNLGLTEKLLGFRQDLEKNSPIVFSSSIQAVLDNPYGNSKKAAETALLNASRTYIYRLPNVFGKWSRPNYNSAVATFCNNIARDIPVTVNDPGAVVNLVYVDDVVQNFIDLLTAFENGNLPEEKFLTVDPIYTTTVGALVEQIKSFKNSRETLITESVGVGLVRALYATYLSFLKPDQFTYMVPRYVDPRGVFVEALKTKDSGQFSFFTAHAGITRGGHYHHTKTEKFLVIKGIARFKFLHIQTHEAHEVTVDAAQGSTIVETIPGWSHDITNVGTEELIVMLWANEIFDRLKPDTVAHKV